MSFSPEGRLVIVTNPASTQYKHVEHDVIDRLDDSGFLPVVFETPAVNPQDNIDVLREIVEPDDRVIVAGGDGTGNIAVNAIMESGQEEVQVGFLAYGNFNDMASTFTGRRHYKDPLALATSETTVDAYPLRVDVDGQYDRHAMLYASLGWSADASAAFNTLDARRDLQDGKSTFFHNFRKIAHIYQSTKDSAALADFTLGDDSTVYKDATDILMTNGLIAAKMIRTGQRYYEGTQFLRTVIDATKLHHNIPFISLSILNFITLSKLKLHLPGEEVASEVVSFDQASVGIQADGEYRRHNNVNHVTITKEEKPLTVTTPVR